MISGMWVHTVVWKDNVAFSSKAYKGVVYSFRGPSLSEFLAELADQGIKDATVVTEPYPHEVPD